MNLTKKYIIGCGSSIGILGLLAGCVGYVDGPRGEVVYARPAVVVEPGIVVQDDFIYYPGYQVYYSSTRRQYMYLEGRSWVTRSSPPRVSAEVLFASPSVRLDFHDSPANHHEAILRAYPHDWRPEGRGRGEREGDRGGERGGERGGDRSDRREGR